jgi:hypothetical protein
MSSPVVVSRIQNRRGLQDQFNGPNGIYPFDYNGIGGYNSIPDFNENTYPNVLLPGEIAFCTDTRRVFIGNDNGRFTELDTYNDNSLMFEPLSFVLDPSPTFVLVTKEVPTLPVPTTVVLEFAKTPFYTIPYSAAFTNSNPDWNAIGSLFSRNGTLQITAVDTAPLPPPPPPFAAPTPVTLSDISTEINATPSNISFIAQYNIDQSRIQILYMHDFPGPITFSTTSISWLPFAG